MGEAKTRLRPELRIFCLCGQKMKVTASMYGRPGKCVACRQKIRIPRLDEVPAGTTELFLRDHPELLRKTQPNNPRSPGNGVSYPGPVSDQIPDQDLLLGDDAEQERSAPIDPLRPLQILCSFDARIAERLSELREAAQDTELAREKTALMGYRALVRNARADMDEQLRQRLHEVTDQLSDTRERIARASLALRVGDLSYAQFIETITPLRIRRDRLERRRINLTGWLHTHDPYLAGGFVDLPFEEIPVSGVEVGFPMDDRDAAVLLESCLGALRGALTERDEARRKLSGMQRMQREGDVPPLQSQRLMKDTEARVQRARLHVEFERGRVEQFVQDCESDIRAIRAHLEEAQASVERGANTPQDYADTEHRMLQAQGDLNESRALARKALRAERPDEVPGPKTTLMRRMKRRDQESLVLENLTAWVSSLALAIAVFLPLVAGQSGSNLSNFPALVALFLTSAVAFAFSAMFPDVRARGLSMLVIWVLTTVLSVLALRVAQYGVTPVGGIMRTNAQWFLTPGMLLYAAALAGLGLAASVTLAKLDQWRSLPLAGALVAVACIGLIVTDGAQIFVSRPELAPPTVSPSAQQRGLYEVAIPVTNSGYRHCWIGGSPERVPDPVRFTLEKKIGEQLSWEDYTPRQAGARAGETLGGSLLQPQLLPVTQIPPGETRFIRYTLEPGIYRASLLTTNFGTPIERMEEFEVVSAEPPAAEEAMPEENAQAPEASEAEPAPLLPQVERASVKLQGVLDSQGQDPQFSIVLETADGRIINQRIGLGGQVAGEWIASEYSPATQNLTLSDGQRMLVLERGQSIAIEYTTQPEPAAADPRFGS